MNREEAFDILAAASESFLQMPADQQGALIAAFQLGFQSGWQASIDDELWE